jgi:hypothetical protein
MPTMVSPAAVGSGIADPLITILSIRLCPPEFCGAWIAVNRK